MGTKIIQDGTLTDIADAIRAKTGKSATMTPLEMPSEIESIETGGGSSGGLVKRTGTVSIASNYTYTKGVNVSYDGIEIDTGLSNIYSVVAYSQNWKNGVTDSNSYAFSIAINNGIQTGNENASYPPTFYSSFALIWNGAARPFYGSAIQGIILPMTSNGLANSKFGIKTHGTGFPLLAGDTLVWEAVGEE